MKLQFVKHILEERVRVRVRVWVAVWIMNTSNCFSFCLEVTGVDSWRAKCRLCNLCPKILKCIV